MCGRWSVRSLLVVVNLFEYTRVILNISGSCYAYIKTRYNMENVIFFWHWFRLQSFLTEPFTIFRASKSTDRQTFILKFREVDPGFFYEALKLQKSGRDILLFFHLGTCTNNIFFFQIYLGMKMYIL